MKNRNFFRYKKTEFVDSSGFTLVEVLVSVVILALGILGTIAMQARGLMDNQDAYLRTQAILLVYDIGDRIRANESGWQNVPEPGEGSCDSDDSNCEPVAMAQDDIFRWQNEVQKKLPNGQGNIQFAGDLCSEGNANGLRVQVTWDRANKDANDRLGQACFSLDVDLGN